MRRLRRALGVVSAVWLIAQLTTLAVTPAELWLSGDDTCQCAHGAGAVCPMHHPTPSGRGTCAMHGTAPFNDVVLTSLLGAAGCFLTTPSVRVNWSVTTGIRLGTEHLLSQFVPSDSPPPRA